MLGDASSAASQLRALSDLRKSVDLFKRHQ